MRRIFSAVLFILLVLGICLPVYAQEGSQQSNAVDVIIKYMQNDEISKIPIKNGQGSTVIDNVTIQVSEAPEEAAFLVIYSIPPEETEVWNWFADCLADDGSLILPYYIYFLDQEGNKIKAAGTRITLQSVFNAQNGAVFSVAENGKTTELESTGITETTSISFLTDENLYYALIEKEIETGTILPDEEWNETNLGHTAQTGDDTNLKPAGYLTVALATLVVLFLCARKASSH